MFKPGPGVALFGVGWRAGLVTGEMTGRDLSRDDDPPLPASQEEVPGPHQVGVSVQLAPGVLS